MVVKETSGNRWMSVADPIHGIIQFDRDQEIHRLLLSVMNSRAFQRLRRIKQMGLAEFVFPGATHSRFVHSLGATHLMMKTIDWLRRSSISQAWLESSFDDTGISLQTLLLLGILIHDIGHGPLSHTLEDVLELKSAGIDHDHYWNQRILTEDKELQRIWKRYGSNLPDAVLRFTGEEECFEKHRKRHFLSHLVSSQLDMDRLDYLQRDSHFLGVQYGRIEAERIIGNLEITQFENDEPVLAIREEAVPAIEHYLFGRHQAYKMALHSLDKASEAILKKTLERFYWVRQRGRSTGFPAEELYRLMLMRENQTENSLSVEQYLRLDDCYLWFAIQSWAHDADDDLLRMLADRLLKHDIFKFVDLAKYGYNGSFETLSPVYDSLKRRYTERGLSFQFGFAETKVSPRPMYLPEREPIWVWTARGVSDLMSVSSLPIAVMPEKGEKHLLFVWDSEMRRYLSELLNIHFKRSDEMEIASTVEGF